MLASKGEKEEVSQGGPVYYFLIYHQMNRSTFSGEGMAVG